MSLSESIEEKIRSLNQLKECSGIIVQLPLPGQLQQSSKRFLELISPWKDPDCLHSINRAKLRQLKQRADIIPCTPYAVLKIIQEEGIQLENKKTVIIGQSDLVGAPLAELLSEKTYLTTCNTKTSAQTFAKVVSEADIVISATGMANLIQRVKPGSVLIDIGISRDSNNKLSGDISQGCKQIASKYTPVPGGVGPMTVMMLMTNVVSLWQKSLQKEK